MGYLFGTLSLCVQLALFADAEAHCFDISGVYKEVVTATGEEKSGFTEVATQTGCDVSWVQYNGMKFAMSVAGNIITASVNGQALQGTVQSNGNVVWDNGTTSIKQQGGTSSDWASASVTAKEEKGEGARLTCVCDGNFSQGQRVILLKDDPYMFQYSESLPPVGTEGTVIRGDLEEYNFLGELPFVGKLTIDWDGPWTTPDHHAWCAEGTPSCGGFKYGGNCGRAPCAYIAPAPPSTTTTTTALSLQCQEARQALNSQCGPICGPGSAVSFASEVPEPKQMEWGLLWSMTSLVAAFALGVVTCQIHQQVLRHGNLQERLLVQ